MKHVYKLIITLLLLGLCVSGVQAATVYNNFVPVMTSNTTPSPNESVASSFYGTGHEAFRAFDHIFGDYVTGSRWLSATVSVPQYVQIYTATSHVANNYTVWATYRATDATYPSQYTPRSWMLNASNDGSTWTTLDTRSSLSWENAIDYNPNKTFTFSNTVPYKYHRLVATQAGTSAEFMVITEIALVETINSPVASFSSMNITPVTNTTGESWGGPAPITMMFNDTSTNAPTSWAWAVNNVTGNNTWVPLGTARNITPTFGVGNWSVNLTATNLAGSGTSTQITYVNVSAPPMPSVSFNANPNTGVNPLTVTFNDTTTSGSPITSYNASFGDGTWRNETTFPATNITHLYSTAGNYTVDWYVSNAEGTGLASTTITVWGAVHSEFSLFNAAGTAPHTTYLYDQSTNLTPGPVTYLTDFGDGNTSTSQNVFYTWNITGEYNVTHTVSNGLSSETSFMNVTVGTPTPPVVAPVASFYGGPQTGNVPLTVFFTDVSSNAPTSWNWSFGDGVYSELQNPTHSYNRSGFRTVNLTATNSAGSNITVKPKFVRVS